jgi:hypothetical protein
MALRLFLWSALLTIGVAPAASAQTCAGALSFNFAPLQVGGAVQASAGGRAAAASVAAGSDRLFGAISSGLGFSELDRRAAHVALAVGTDQPLTLDNRLHVCPVATATYARRQGNAAAGAGGHVTFGWVARNTAGRVVVQSAAYGVRHLPDGAPDARRLEHAAEIQAAVGFILRGRLAVTPRVMFARRRPATLAVELTFDAR